ncbi:MAG: ferrous iron transport protein B [Bacteroidales bacterium]
MGQPNAGKSTFFNYLTGSNQHVGNWPGKTVEKKTGMFVRNGKTYHITDLPGSYSLSANSQEEMVTRDFIASGQADLVCILADASQLERSMFMVADYSGIKCPVILIINMIDVAQKQGKTINGQLLEKRLGIPVVLMSASQKKEYDSFIEALDRPLQSLKTEALFAKYKEALGNTFTGLCELTKNEDCKFFSSEWLAIKLLENDKDIILKKRKQNLPLSIENTIKVGSCKFDWIKELLDGIVTGGTKNSEKMGRFDRIATSHIWGKPLAVLLLVFGLVMSFAITVPWMFFSFKLPRIIFPFIHNWLSGLGSPGWTISLSETLFNACGTSIGMIGFIAGSSLVFGFLEDVGYMARVAYVFDGAMSKIKLQGKSMMAFMMSFGCSMGGSLGARVVDSWGQRVLTMALAWLMPCAGTWAVISVFGTAFFGINTIWILLSMFLCSAIIMLIAAKVFSPKLVGKTAQYGMIMELPPYHAPKWGSLFRLVFSRMGSFAKRAFTFILGVTAVFWFLAFTPDGHIENSLIYKFGTYIEPVTMWVGLRWQTFVAFVCSMMGKEAALGVLSSVFGTVSQVVGRGEVSPDLATQMSSVLTKAEALAFMFAFYFNIPCFVAVLSMKEESHSLKWTLRIMAFYITIALIMSASAYYIGMMIF